MCIILAMYNTLKWIDCGIFVIIYFVFFMRRYRQEGIVSFLSHTVAYIYFLALLYLTLFPLVLTFDKPSINLLPFRDYLFAFGDYEFQIINNVLLFIPMGFFIPYFKKTGFVKSVLIGMSISILIELSQPWVTLYRVMDVTDVITNTLGALIGVCIYYIGKRKGAKAPNQ